jgi:hypothetical protein
LSAVVAGEGDGVENVFREVGIGGVEDDGVVAVEVDDLLTACGRLGVGVGDGVGWEGDGGVAEEEEFAWGEGDAWGDGAEVEVGVGGAAGFPVFAGGVAPEREADASEGDGCCGGVPEFDELVVAGALVVLGDDDVGGLSGGVGGEGEEGEEADGGEGEELHGMEGRLAEGVEGRIGRRGQCCRDGEVAQVFVCGETDNARGADEHEVGRVREKQRFNSPFT